MYVIVEDAPVDSRGYVRQFEKEGIACVSLMSDDFHAWLSFASGADIEAIRGFVIGEIEQKKILADSIRNYCRAPVFAVVEDHSLDEKVDLLTANFDDVFQKAVHVKEILARSQAIWRRVQDPLLVKSETDAGRLKVFFNGRDPEIDGEPVAFPRRERQILEFLISNRSKRVTRAQIFSYIYGVFDNDVDEKAVECILSRLRKRLRTLLGFDPVDAKRFIGYQYVGIKFSDSAMTAS